MNTHEELMQNNVIHIEGMIASDFIFNHEIYGEKFYLMYVSSVRKSGSVDTIPVIISERIIETGKNCVGIQISIEGQIRTRNMECSGRTHLSVFLFCKSYCFVEECSVRTNEVMIDGYLCNTPKYRKTTNNREISDMLLAVNRPYGKSDYIPCICWGRNAIFAAGLKTGVRIKLHGRFQSRTYTKKYEDGSEEEKVAYEVSVYQIEKFRNPENEMDGDEK